MKHLLVTFIGLFLLAYASASEPIPAEIQRIISIRESEIGRIDRQYRAALERLKLEYTQNGDLETALLLRNLITELDGGSSVDTPAVSTTSEVLEASQSSKLGPNLATNGSFENGNVGWFLRHSKVKKELKKGRSDPTFGKYCLVIDFDKEARPARYASGFLARNRRDHIRYLLSITADQKVRASVFLKCTRFSKSSEPFEITMQLGNSKETLKVSESSEEWVELVTVAECAAGKYNIDIFISVEDPEGVIDAELWLDHLQVQEVLE